MKTLFAIILLTLSYAVLAQQSTHEQTKELYNNLTICEIYYNDIFMTAMEQYGANQPNDKRELSLEMSDFFGDRALNVLILSGPHAGNEVNSQVWHDVVGQKDVRKIMNGFTDNQVAQLPKLCGALRNQVEMSSQR